MIKDGIEEIKRRKRKEKTRVNRGNTLNSQYGLWDWDNHIESKPQKIYSEK
jgi:hypothetical protein